MFLVESLDDYENMLKFVFEKPLYIPGSIKKYLSEQLISSRDFNEKILKQMKEESNMIVFDLEKIRLHTFILHGDEDKIFNVALTKKLGNALIHSNTVIMKNCGHMPMIERPEEAANHYRKFLGSM